MLLCEFRGLCSGNRSQMFKIALVANLRENHLGGFAESWADYDSHIKSLTCYLEFLEPTARERNI